MAKKKRLEYKRQLNYLCAAIVVHGDTEEEFVKYIRRALKIKFKIIPREGSVQLLGLFNELNKRLADLTDFEDELDIQDGKVINDFKIFTIVDFDDCKPKDHERYLNKTLFDGYKYKDYVVPIYNNGNLEEVFKDVGIYSSIPHKSDKMKMLKKAFPSLNNEPEIVNVEELYHKFSNSNKTNMEVMIEYLLKNVNKNSDK